MLYEQLHYHDGEASFLQAMFKDAVFISHPADVPELSG
jgi:hypothetical protein